MLLFVAILLCGGVPLLAQSDAEMTFTTQRNNSAVKDWAPDTTILIREGKRLTIRGLNATGRTDYPYQELHMVINNFTGPGTYNLQSDTYFEDLFGSRLVKTTFQSGTITVDHDISTGKFTGDFAMLLYSNPPNLDPVTTRIYNGKFSVTPVALMLQAVTNRDTIRARAGDKDRRIKVVATDEYGTAVKDVDLSVLNPVAGGAKSLGKSDQNGELLYSFDVDAKTETGEYTIKFYGKKTKYKDAEELHKIITISSRYWTYTCGGVELFTFDAGEGNEWKQREAPSKALDATGSTVTINDILKFDGKMTIEPEQNRVIYDGQLYVPNIPLPGGEKGNLNLNTNSQGDLSLNCNTLLKWAIPEVCKTKLGGLTFSLEELEFVDLQVEYGLKLKVQVAIDAVVKGCSKSNDATQVKLAGGMTISPSGIQEWRIEATNGLFYNPYFCMNDLKISYDAVKDTWTASVAMQAQGLTDPKKVTSLKGGFTIIKGVLDAANVEFKSGECYPIPETPLCIFGGTVGFTGRSTGFNTNGSISAGLFFKTDEALILQRFPWLSSVFNDPGLAEISVNGKWTYPKKFSGGVTTKLLKFPAISVTKPWQIEVSGTAEIDVDNEMVLSPSNVKAFHFGADDYFITANGGKVRFTWGKDLMMEEDYGDATLRIPDVPSDAVDHFGRAFLKMLKGKGVLPATLGTANAYVSVSQSYGMKMEAYVDLSSNPVSVLQRLGRSSIKLEASDKTNGNMKFTISSGGTDLVSIGGITARKDGSPSIQSADSRLPGPFVARALDTFTVKSNLERMNILIEGQSSAPPVAYLIAPDGTRYDKTTSDSKIIIDEETPGDVRMLTVVNPAPGAWILGLVNPKPTDSVTVILPPPAPRTFDITASAANRVLTVTWNKTALTSDDMVAIHLDRVDGGGSVLIGIVPGNTGSFEYTLGDDLSECSYKVSAVLSGDGNPPITANANGEIETGKTILPPPMNITVLTNTAGEATVTWSASPDPNVQNYLIYVRGVEEHDSLLTIVPAFQTVGKVAADTALLRTLFMRSADHDGHIGCPAPATSVGFLGVEENHGAGTGATMSSVTVVPNPTRGTASIQWNAGYTASTVVEIRNMLGETVARFDRGRIVQGRQEVQWATDGVAEGTYLVVVHAGATVRTAKVTVVR